MSHTEEIRERLDRIDENILALGDILHSLAGTMSDEARDRLVKEFDTVLAADPDRPIRNAETISEHRVTVSLPD